MTKKNIAILITILLVLVLAGIFFFRMHTPAPVSTQVLTDNTTPDHQWIKYESVPMGITFEYPADLLTPVAANATATSSVSFYLNGVETPKSVHLVIIKEDTDVSTAAEYFAKYLPNTEKGLISTTTVDGIPAIALYETAYAYITAYVVHADTLYIVNIDLPPTEAERVIDSIRFAEAH